MPTYEYLCEKCQKPFEITMTLSKREKAKIRCPKCKSTNITPQLSGIRVQTSKKS